MKKLRVLDLFSGIGGFSLGLERTGGFETAAFCEIEDYPRKVLAKHWPDVHCYKDVRELNGKEITNQHGRIDAITGGFPCQDLSIAGKQKGIDAERSGLWSEIVRLSCELRPSFIIVENVSNLLSGPSQQRGEWFGKVLSDLASIGYDAEWHSFDPAITGLQLSRPRVWVVAYPKKKYVAQVVDPGRLSPEHRGMGAAHISRTGWSVDKCRMGRGINGIPDEVDRFECLGNTVVPQIPEMIGYAILEAERERK